MAGPLAQQPLMLLCSLFILALGHTAAAAKEKAAARDLPPPYVPASRNAAFHVPLPVVATAVPFGAADDRPYIVASVRPGRIAGHSRKLLACGPTPILLENNCRYGISIALHAYLSKPDLCLEGFRQEGSWCTRAWYNMEPGETGGPIFNTHNEFMYVFAVGRDGHGGRLDWNADPEEDTPWLDMGPNNPTARPCMQGSSPYCEHFARMDMGSDCLTDYTVALSCDNYVEEGEQPPAAAEESADSAAEQ